MRARLAPIILAAICIVPLGCVRRTISIRTEPPGALVWLNDREVGRTPVDVDFVYYGTYDVRIEKEGYEPLMTSGKADAPLWDMAGPDLVAEILPLDLHSRIEWTFDLAPIVEDEAGLIERARALRAGAAEEAAATDGGEEGPSGDEGS